MDEAELYKELGTLTKSKEKWKESIPYVSSLLTHIDCNARLEFHGEVVGEDGDLLDELFDHSLIKLCDVSFLTSDEVLQLLGPVHGFFPVVAVELGLFLLVAQPENLIGDGVIPWALDDGVGTLLPVMQSDIMLESKS